MDQEPLANSRDHLFPTLLHLLQLKVLIPLSLISVFITTWIKNKVTSGAKPVVSV